MGRQALTKAPSSVRPNQFPNCPNLFVTLVDIRCHLCPCRCAPSNSQDTQASWLHEARSVHRSPMLYAGSLASIANDYETVTAMVSPQLQTADTKAPTSVRRIHCPNLFVTFANILCHRALAVNALQLYKDTQTSRLHELGPPSVSGAFTLDEWLGLITIGRLQQQWSVERQQTAAVRTRFPSS
jgi:hypothetical protein